MFLKVRQIACERRHIVENPPTAEDLRQFLRKSGLPLRRFFNTGGLKYKALHLKNKLAAMSEDEQLALLASDGMLIKRPLLIGDDFVLLGFRKDEWEKTLNPKRDD